MMRWLKIEKQLDGEVAEEALKKREVKRIRITGKEGMNEKEAAILIISEAQNFIKHELGIKTISWKTREQKDITVISKSSEIEEKNHSLHSTVINNKDKSSSEKRSVVSEFNKYPTKIECNHSEKDDSNNAANVQADVNLNSVELPDIRKSLTPISCENNKLIINSEIKSEAPTSKDIKLENLNLNCSNKVRNYEIRKIDSSNPSFKSTADSCVKKDKVSVIKSPSDVIHENSCEIRKNVHNLNNAALNSCSVLHENISNINFIENTCVGSVNENKIYGAINEDRSATVVQREKCQKPNCSVNESFFATEVANNLFEEIEKTVLERENKKLNEEEMAGENDNLTFSQLLLSQSAQVGDVYLAQSFKNSVLDDSSFSGCLEENNDASVQLSDSIRLEMQNKFTNQKTRDILDNIFDSPISEEFNKEANVNKINEKSIENISQLLNTDASFDIPFDSSISFKENKTKRNSQINSLKKHFLQSSNVISNKNFKDNVLKTKSFDNKSHLNTSNVNKTLAAQSTPKADVSQVKIFGNEETPVKMCLPDLIENCNLDFSAFNFSEIKPNNSESSKSPTFEAKSEVSGDLFESEESLDGDILNKAQLKPPDIMDNVHSTSSCSDDIFASDKSFEKMLENQCEGENICDITDKNLNKKDGDEAKIKLNFEDEKFTSDIQISPNTLNQVILDNSGDIFEDSIETEQIFNNPKKHLSFILEENSDIFKSWNPSPTIIAEPKSESKNKVHNHDKGVEKSALNNTNNYSFIGNLSDFSHFLSESTKCSPAKKGHKSKTESTKSISADFKVTNQDNSIVKKNEIDHFEKLDRNSNEINVSNSNLKLGKSLSINDKDFKIVDILDDEFHSFIKLLEDVPMFGISVACEKAEHKSVMNIGPPKFQAKQCSKSVEKIYVNDSVLIAGISFCWSEKAFFMSFPSDVTDGITNVYLSDIKTKLKAIQKSFEKCSSKTVVAYDLKSYYSILNGSCHISLSKHKNISYFDPSIAAWLLDPSDGQLTLRELVLNFWPEGYDLIEEFDKGHGSLGLQHWSSIPGRQRAATESYISFQVIEKLLNKLREKKLLKSFIDIEMPSIITLAKMEQNGLGFNLKLAMDFRKELQKKQSDLLKKAYQLAGHSFNIMSSRDLSRILYKELKLIPAEVNLSPMARRQLSLGIVTRNSAKKLPPELKTNRECLEKIMHLHPLPKVVMDWRKLSFAVSKVLMPLLRENKFDKELQMYRMHSTCYVYTVTGRVNMHKPNLQFIPRDFNIDESASEIQPAEPENEQYCIDNEISQYGVSLRNMFVASEGNILLSADYSQLELRILAHLSGDVKLLKSLNSGDDIFKQIAASWKNIPISSVTDDIRQQAKKICYGIIYGMGAKTLSHQLSTSENEASYFMETFKRCYPGMSNYLNLVLENCRRKGYVTTIMERRRYLPHILSESRGERAQAERQAINTTVQGSAADIIKKAMIEIEKQLTHMFGDGATNSRKQFRGALLVLQLHDELMYEVCKQDLEPVKNIVKAVMEKSTALSVILPVNLRVGASWGSMKEI